MKTHGTIFERDLFDLLVRELIIHLILFFLYRAAKQVKCITSCLITLGILFQHFYFLFVDPNVSLLPLFIVRNGPPLLGLLGFLREKDLISFTGTVSSFTKYRFYLHFISDDRLVEMFGWYKEFLDEIFKVLIAIFIWFMIRTFLFKVIKKRMYPDHTLIPIYWFSEYLYPYQIIKSFILRLLGKTPLTPNVVVVSQEEEEALKA
jgi:hypothetical protein